MQGPVVIASDTKTEFLGANGWAPSSVVSFPVWADVPNANWIWSKTAVSQEEAVNGSGIVTFRRIFNVPVDAKALTASIQITADNAYELTFNGKLIGNSGSLDRSTVDPDYRFEKIDTYNVQLRRGENEILIRAVNYKYPGDPAAASPSSNPAGVVFLLRQSAGANRVPVAGRRSRRHHG
jgi:hypothetical protein